MIITLSLESKVTDIYCMIDDFCNKFTFQQEKYVIIGRKTGDYNKFDHMSNVEIIMVV